MSAAHQRPVPVLGLTLSDAVLTDLTTQRSGRLLSTIRSALELTSASIIYLGSDRFRPENAGSQTPRLDPLFAAQWLLSKFPSAAALVSTSTEVEHPFNYGRRSLALDHFTGGRLGVVLGSRDTGTQLINDGTSAWTGTPVGAELAADFAWALRKLWNSWPSQTIIADKENGVFADSSGIVKVNHDSLYTIRGPLNAPTSVQGEPPLGWHVVAGAQEAPHTQQAELVIASTSAALHHTGSDQLAVMDTSPEDLTRIPSRADGALLRLRSAADAAAVIDLLAEGTSPGSEGAARTLRERLGLSPRQLDISEYEPAFAGESSVKGVL